MFRINNIVATVSVLIAGLLTQVQAQAPADGDLSTSIVQEVELQITLDSAERLYENAAYAVPRAVVVEKQTYQTQDFKLKLNSLDHKIKVFTVKQPPVDPLKKHYVRAGIGNYTTPYLDVFTGSDRSDKFSYAVRAKHLSSKTGSVNKKASGNSQNVLGLGATYNLNDKTKVGLDLGYERWGYKFYGSEVINEEQEEFPLFSEKILEKQRISMFDAAFSLDSKLSDAFLLGFGASFGAVSDKYDAKEREIGLSLGGLYSISSDSKVDVDLEAYLTKRTDSAVINRNYFAITPMYQTIKGKVLVNAGAKVVYENDTLSDRSNVHVYPRVDLQYQLTEKITPYVGLSGDMMRNTYRSMVTENRFVAQDIVLLNSNKAIEFYGGAKGSLTDKVGFNTRLAYQNYKGLYFFTYDPSNLSKFAVVYEEGNTTVVNVIAELQYEKLEKFKAGLSLEANAYNLSDLSAAYHRPAFQTKFFSKYNLNKKLSVNTDIFYISGLKALDLNGTDVMKIKSIVDLNLGAEYLFNKKLSAFLELNNLLSRKYEYYRYYPVQGFNMMLGATYSF